MNLLRGFNLVMWIGLAQFVSGFFQSRPGWMVFHCYVGTIYYCVGLTSRRPR